MISVPFLILTMDIMTCSLDDDMLFILPAPQNITFSDNKGLLLLSNPIVCCPNHSRIQLAAERWLQNFPFGGKVVRNNECSIRAQNETRVSFIEVKDSGIHMSEYTLVVDGDGVRISAMDEEGLFHGLMTLKQITAQSPRHNDSNRWNEMDT